MDFSTSMFFLPIATLLQNNCGNENYLKTAYYKIVPDLSQGIASNTYTGLHSGNNVHDGEFRIEFGSIRRVRKTCCMVSA